MGVRPSHLPHNSRFYDIIVFMLYYLYEIRNNLNNKIYVGVHKTKSIDDGYMGSGKVIKRAVKKYGLENFTKVILEYFEDSKSMYAREAELITNDFLEREDVYNLRRGGSGGFDYINKCLPTTRIPVSTLNNRRMERLNSDIEFKKSWQNKSSEVLKDLYNSGWVCPQHEEEYLKGMREKALSEEARRKQILSFRRIGHQKGTKNSQYGTVWITNGVLNNKVHKDLPLPAGYRKGRSINKE